MESPNKKTFGHVTADMTDFAAKFADIVTANFHIPAANRNASAWLFMGRLVQRWLDPSKDNMLS